MAVIDLDALLRPVSEEHPCGENLEDSMEFMQLEQTLDLAPPPMVEGAQADEDRGPNWEEVRDNSLDFFERSKDLRISLVLIRALLGANGLAGFQEGVALLSSLVDAYWEPIHPQVTPDDIIYRSNIMAGLVDPQQITAAVRTAPLVTARGYGSFSLRDVEAAAAAGEPDPDAPDGPRPPSLDEINGAFMETDVEDLQRDVAAGRQVMVDLDGLDAKLSPLGVDLSADHLGRLKGALHDALELLTQNLEKRGVPVAGAGDPVGEETPGEPGAGGGGAPAAAPQATGGIANRGDVIRQLELICEYLEKNEPSSPVPLLLRRAKRLVSKSFMEIINDMAPEGVAQARLIGGLDSTDE